MSIPTTEEIQHLKDAVLQYESFVNARAQALMEAQAKLDESRSSLAAALYAAGIKSINTGTGYLYEWKETTARTKFTEDALEVVKAFDSELVEEYFTPQPKMTIKGLEQVYKDGRLPKDLYQMIYTEHAEHEGGGEITLTKKADKEFFKDVSL